MALSDLMASDAPGLGRLGVEALISRLRSAAAPRALAVGERFERLDQVIAERYRECARVAAPRLPTGYQPGLRVGSERVQVVYRLEAPP